MSKISFTKLVHVTKREPVEKEINGQMVTIIQYLPVAEKASFSERVINAAMDPTINFASDARMDVFFALELIRTYTNINLTDKLYNDSAKTYDLLVLNNILQEVIAAIPEDEYNELYDKVYTDRDHLETYAHSIMGLLKSAQTDYNAAAMDADQIMNQLKDPESFKLVKEILDKVG